MTTVMQIHNGDRNPEPAITPATYQLLVNGTRRDALFVSEIAERMFGASDRSSCQRVTAFIRSGQLFALTTGKAYLVPVGAYAAFLRGEEYP